MSSPDLQRTQYRGLTLLTFPASMLSLYAETSSGNVATPHTSSEVMHATGAEAVLDGPMFNRCNPNLGYDAQSCGHVLYKHFDLTSGVNIPSSYPNQGVTISVLRDGSTQAASGAAVPSGAVVAVQLYPELVANGAPVPVRLQDSASRAALAIMRDGKLALVTSSPMTMPDFAQRLAEAGALYAGYTDGGGSTSLETQDGYTGSSEHRRVLTWLLAKARQSTILQTVKGSPGTTVAVIAGVGAIAGFVWWNSRRAKR